MAALDDIEFLVRSPNRVAVLEALTAGPRDRRDLREKIDVSQSTIKRVVSNLVERGWIVHSRGKCEITPFGERVVVGLTTLIETIEAEANLREVVQWLPTNTPGFDVDLFDDAEVTTAEPGAPYRPMKRLMDLVEETDSTTIRAFDTRLLPGYFDKWEVREAMTVEVIFSPIVIDALRRRPLEETAELLESGALTFFVHDDLPCGLTVYDGHIALCGYDRATGMLQAVVDTNDPDAVAWGEDIYTSHRRDAQPVDLAAFTS